jgi:hypothetical protein
MAFPAALFIQSQYMPVSLMLLFSAIAIMSFLAATGSSWLYWREWKNNRDRNPRTPFRLPVAKRLEASLYTSGGLICFAVITSDWRIRAYFGGIVLLGIGFAIFGLRSESKSKPNFDKGSVLHVEPADTHSPSATP